jgi:SAM-dependent methyltransferase
MLWSYDIDLIPQEEEKLIEFFSHYMPDNYKPKKILNFCCGIANEEPVLKKLYGNSIELISFDRDPQMEEMAKDIGRKSFVKGEIQEIETIAKNTYDLLIGRNIPINPNRDFIGHYEDQWSEFLNRAQNKINPDGYLLMTFARDDEFYRGNDLLNSLEYKILIQEENAITIPSDRIGIAGADIKDNYVILAQKPNQ